MVCNIGFMPFMNYMGFGMPYNYYRQPYMSIYGNSYNSYMNNYAAAKGTMDGQRDVLEISYSCLIENLNNFVVQTSGAKADEKLTQEELEQYNELQTKAQELLQRVQNYGFASQNVAVLKAIDDINLMKREYHLLKEAESQLSNAAKTRQVEETQTNPSTETNPSVETNPSNSSEPSDSPEPIEPPTPEEAQNSVIDDYNNNTKPLIKDLLDNKYIGPEDRKAIQEKQKEIEKAIKDNKSAEEISKLCDELNTLYEGVHSRTELNTVSEDYRKNIVPGINELLNNPDISYTEEKNIKDKQNEIEGAINTGASPEEVRKLCDEMEELLNSTKQRIDCAKSVEEHLKLQEKVIKFKENVSTYLNKNKKYIAKDRLDAINNKIKKLESAILCNASKEDLQKIYDELKQLFVIIKSPIDKQLDAADEICQALHDAENIVGRFSFITGPNKDAQKTIEDNVGSIKKDNLLYVLNEWEKLFNHSGYGNNCLLKSLYEKCSGCSSIKNKITDTLAAVCEEYARSKNCYNKISKQISILNGNGSDSEKIAAFKEIIIEINKMNN